MLKLRIKVIVYAALLAFLDQALKYWATLSFKSGPLFLVGESIGFQYSENTGIAFSIALPQLAIILLSIALFFLIFWVFEHEFNMEKPLSQWGVILIIAGGLGNLIDRLNHGYVVDFIALWSYPRFNLADIYISVGVLLIIAFYAKIRRV